MSRWNRYLDAEAALVSAGLVQKKDIRAIRKAEQERRAKAKERYLQNNVPLSDQAKIEPDQIIIPHPEVLERETELALKKASEDDFYDKHPLFSVWLRSQLAYISNRTNRARCYGITTRLKHVQHIWILNGRWHVTFRVGLSYGLTFKDATTASVYESTKKALDKDFLEGVRKGLHGACERTLTFRKLSSSYNMTIKWFEELQRIIDLDYVYTTDVADNLMDITVPLEDYARCSGPIHFFLNWTREHCNRDYLTPFELVDTKGEYSVTVKAAYAIACIPCKITQRQCNIPLVPRKATPNNSKSSRQTEDAEQAKRNALLKKLAF